MATVTLDRVFLNLADDPSTYLSAFSSDRTEVRSVPGEVRRMANGRLRTVSRAGSATSLSATLRNLTAAQVTLLRSWAGQTVLFRDVWGRKMYGAFFAVEVTDYRDRSGQDVKVTFSEVTFSEVV